VTPEALRHALLRDCGVAHGFGVRGTRPPADLARPRQVHGAQVAALGPDGSVAPREADAIVSALPGRAVGIVTADCLPILMAAADGGAVAAVHAGWRGLARGVVAAALRALRARTDAEIVAAIGPHVGPCCYEVDAPVIDALRAGLGDALSHALHPARPGHAQLDLAAVARAALRREGLAEDSVGALADACTCCGVERFHSYRRDGAAAGRLVHFIAAREVEA
jgi:YfiH family protein